MASMIAPLLAHHAGTYGAMTWVTGPRIGSADEKLEDAIAV
jgi:hypothetical protein